MKLNSRFSFLLLCGTLFFLCCGLSVWQWHRYHEKQALLIAFQKRLHEAPIVFLADKSEPLAYRQVKLLGEYDYSSTVLVQTLYQGRPGFDVLTPVRIKGEKKLLLVDRGWVPVYQKERETARLFQAREQLIIGYVKLLNERPFILGKNSLDEKATPVVMQRIDIEQMSRIMQQPLFPYIVRLNKEAPHGFIRDWTLMSILPERHLGYMIQWLLFAGILVVGFIFFSRRQDEK